MSENAFVPLKEGGYRRMGLNPNPMTPRPDYVPAPLKPQKQPVAPGAEQGAAKSTA